MIGRLTGVLAHKGLDQVLLDVNGVGYIVFCTDRTLAALPPVGERASLFTDLLVREDLLQLFGFLTPTEKEWHRLLMTVQGVGAKASMAILSTLGPDGVSRAVTLGDWNAIKAAKGVGPKTAQKVVLELKDKAPSVIAMGGSLPEALSDEVIEPQAPRAAPAGRAQAEALSALTNLGYGQGDAASAIAQASDEADFDTQDLIRAALKLLAPKG